MSLFHRRSASAPQVRDDTLGVLTLAPEGWWTAELVLGAESVALAVGGDREPSPVLLLHVREIAATWEQFEVRVRQFLAAAAHWHRYGASSEITGLRVASLSLPWPKRPDDGMIGFRGGAEDRVWRCDYLGRAFGGLAFDS
jgi:hypothetical protein